MAFGGTFLLAFPSVMAASFAGFYLALWLVLWSFILRGMSHRGRRPHRRHALADVLGLRLRRVERAARGAVRRRARQRDPGRAARRRAASSACRSSPTSACAGRVGILDWYTLSVAVFTTVLLAAHGATYLRLKTTGRCTSAANVSRAGCGRPHSCCFPSSRWRPGWCGPHCTRRWSERPAGLARGRGGPGRSLGARSPGCAEQRRIAPSRDRAR